ncbi:hypothetical protein OV203_37720 [Nannocystis sp. ILAH1]|uniref:hypothetical protein n=1 Tax=unclassified Nannocystis TaxID=2627009 RepID=UPI00226EE3AB|nr:MULTISPECIES: hypothetical protein [unclassified Nannocystis]MCY0992941.1 hypothetical protein [Nannocystis sp. ILAH1]MCY1066226.1 hypothetical protein [Nannocystis sp. RBIL2]
MMEDGTNAAPPWRRRGRGRLHRELGRHHFSVDLTLEAGPAERHTFEVDLEEAAGGWDATYAATIDAAVRFAEEKARSRLHRTDLDPLHVCVKKLVVTRFATTAPLVFYATLLALEEALEIEIPDVKLDWRTLELRLKFSNGKQAGS